MSKADNEFSPVAVEIPTYHTPLRSSTGGNSHEDHDRALAYEMQRQEAESARGLHRIQSSVWHFATNHNKPIFTYLMVFFNIIGFIGTMYEADWELVSFSENPMLGPSAQDLLDAGGQTSELVSCEGEWWRIFAAMFLHAGLIHLAFNMLSLYQLGSQMEAEFGTWQVVLIYSLSGISGQLASAVFLPDSVCIGASGAIFGLFGAQWADFLQNVAFFPELEGRCSHFLQLSMNTVIAIGFTLIPFVNAFAHLAGFITGSLVGYIVLIRKRVYTNSQGQERVKNLTNCQKLMMFMAVFAIVSEILILAVLFGEADVYSKCEWCEYLQCFETPLWNCDMVQASSCSYRSTGAEDGANVEDMYVILCEEGDTQGPVTDQIPTAFDCYNYCGSQFARCSSSSD